MYSRSVTLSFLPESLSPILNSASPKRSTSLYTDNEFEFESFTYFDLPFFVGWPLLGNSLDNHRLVSRFVPLDELLYSEVVNVDALDVVNEIIRHLAHIVLLEKVLILAPLSQEEISAMFGLHIAHFLNHLVAHPSSQELWVSQSHVLCLLDCLLVDDVFEWDLLEVPPCSLIFGVCFDVVLLEGVLFRKLRGFRVSHFLLLFFPEVLLRHYIVFVLLRVPDSVLVNHLGLGKVACFLGRRVHGVSAFLHLLLGEWVDDAWNLY